MTTRTARWLAVASLVVGSGLLAGEPAAAQSSTVTVEVSGTGFVTTTPSFIFCTATCSLPIPADTPLVFNAQPVGGNRFVHWGGACSGSGACQLPANSAATVTATFEPLPTHTLQVTTTGDGFVQSTARAIACGDACTADILAGEVTLIATPAGGTEFVGWSGDCSGTAIRCVVDLNADASVGAEFRPRQQPVLSVTGTAGGRLEERTVGGAQGMSCIGQCSASASFASGTLVSLVATPDTGYSIARWTGACEASNTGGGGRRSRYGADGGPRLSCDVRVDGDRTGGVEFVRDPEVVNKLTVTVVGQGFVNGAEVRFGPNTVALGCPTDCEIEVPDGTAVQLTATPADGFVLGAWDGACAGRGGRRDAGADPNVCGVAVAGETVVTATFVRAADAAGSEPRLRVVVVGQGSVTSGTPVVDIDCPGRCEYGGGDDVVSRADERARLLRLRRAGVPLTATAAAGHRFAGWTNCVGMEGDNSCRLAADFSSGTETITATFEPTGTTAPPTPPTQPPALPRERNANSAGVLMIIQQILEDQAGAQ